MKLTLLETLRSAVDSGRACATVTDIETGRQALMHEGRVFGDLPISPQHAQEVFRLVASDKSSLMADGKLFVRVYNPPPRMVVVGAVHIAQSLAPMAKLAGFDVTVIDPRAGFVQSGNLGDVKTVTEWPDEAMGQIAPDSRTAVITLTHDPKLDDPALSAALHSPAFYIGALGSKKTHAKRLQRLAAEGFSEQDLRRIHGPVGMDINAVSPAEIAVSIMAQVVATLRAEA